MRPAALALGAAACALIAAGAPISAGPGGGGGRAPVAAAPAAWAGTPPPTGTPYADPDKRFTVTYPAGWHVRRQGGATSFYLDDPDEGTGFLIARFEMKGELDAAQVFETLAGATRKRYPDFKVVGHEQRTLPAKPGSPPATVFEAEALWTNTRHTPMGGWTKVLAVPAAGHGVTTVSYVGYQAPRKDLGTVGPVFDGMLKSLTYTSGR